MVGEYMMCWKGGASWYHTERTGSSPFPPRPHPVCALYNQPIVIITVLFLSSVNHSRELLNLRGLWERLNLQPIKIIGGLGTPHTAGIQSESSLVGDHAL